MTLLGLLISNITKNTITGYGVSMGYFIFQIVGGNFILGKYCPILATSFNLTLKEHIIINNLYFMIIISIILFLINLLYISNEKKIKRCVLKITGLALIIFSIIILRNKYIDYKKSALVSKIISNNKETVYIIDKQNERLFSYCKSKNISFLTEDNVSLEKYKDKNIIVISKYDSRLINNIKDKLKLNMGLDKRDLILEDHGIYNVSSYRILLNNPLNKENKILLIETRSLNRKDLDVLLNGKQGSFVAVKNGMILATKIYDTKHINIDNFFEDVSTCQSNSWKIKKNNKAQMLYRNIEKKDSEKLFCLWYKIKKIIDKNIKCDNCKEHFQVYLRDDNIKLEENFIPFKIELLLDLEQEREYKVRDMFSKKYLDEKGFKFIRDNRLKDGWMEFINQVIIYPSIYNDNSFGNEYIRIMKQKTKEERELTTEDDYIYLSGKILFLIENNNKRMEFIREIINRDSYIDNNEIEKIYSKYVGIKIAKDQMKYFNKR
ncbi:hypothetical protein [Clostridium niameyense]|uniref:hypothetical protein n=1 Tax=Clostridium niameyense TaxID=1622073 RepID=UPI00101ADE60|nr:hypothetical protein [Clostridium niameyense]